VFSQARYAKQFEILHSLNLDVIALNEVTKEFIEVIREEKWVQEGYFLSDAVGDQSTFDPEGNLLLMRAKPNKILSVDVPTLQKKVITAFLDYKRSDGSISSFAFFSAHLLAYAQNHEKRKYQMEYLYFLISSQLPVVENIVIFGDLNFHLDLEDEFIGEGFLDVWSSLMSNDSGYTWDSKTNPMIEQMYLGLEDRRMRLDRILYRGNWNPKSIRIIANQPVFSKAQPIIRYIPATVGKPWWFKVYYSPIYTLTTIYGLFMEFLGYKKRDPTNYLFPSDHFGLVAHLE